MRPARSIARLSTSSTGRTPSNSRWPSSVIVTPTSTRSRPAFHVPASRSASLYGARCSASRPQRMPLSATQSRMRARSSSSSRKRRRTGSRSARSSTSEAVRRRPARSISWATTPSTGLVWRSERSARRTRRSVGRSSSGSGSNSSSMTSPAPKVAWISGANASMSGHMTITSRGCSVSSSSSRWRIASRRTSTWRARPWQEWIWMLRSAGSSSRGCGRRSARTSAWMRASRLSPPGSTGWWWGTCSCVPSTSCISRASWPQEASRRLSASAAVVSSARRTTGSRSPILSHSAGEGWRRKTWTSRPAASARRTSRWPAGSRVRPKSERRSGRPESAGSARSRSHAGSSRSAGLGCCEPRAQPAPELRLPGGLVRQVDLAARPPADHRRPVQRVAVEQLGEVPDGREAARAAVGVVRGAEVDREAAQPRLVQALADDVEQRPDGARRRPRIGLGIDARGGRDGVADEPVRERELDVRAHAVGAPGRRPEARGQPLRQPALHPSGRHRDDVRRERVGQRIGEQFPERGDEAVGAFSAVDVQHRSWRGRPPANHSDK